MEFNPNNNVVKLCLQGMGMEEKGKPEEASKLFLQAWNEATYDFEKFISAHYVARYQKNISDKLKWLETALQFALKINNNTQKAITVNVFISLNQQGSLKMTRMLQTKNFPAIRYAHIAPKHH
jgi:hypothetical protein